MNKPPDLTANRLPEILANHGHTPQQLLADATHDPYGEAGETLEAITDTENRMPHHYRTAVATDPTIVAWADQLIAGARANQSKTHALRPYVQHGPSLLLLGITGVGKTHEAYGTLRHIACAGIRSAWRATPAADLYALLRPRHNVDSEAEFRKFADARLLLIDDLGAAKTTEWTEEINYRLVNHRYEHELPTVITSNLAPKELAAALGERVFSRLSEMCQRIVLKGVDRRREAA
ncbi:ATP-binding protein [Kitasatospora sp. NBC_01302]|uniref:ATP-binding protein n=1 Tax=Kitasatospora sp. NBC_01302 TaxID=2903575 RepID=UPI002E0E700A|nr:ATP-binding protein [Kitasatospora sp. NBC_01302]